MLIAQKQVIEHWSNVESYMYLHLIFLDPVSAFMALLANIQIPGKFISGCIGRNVLDSDSWLFDSASENLSLHLASTSSFWLPESKHMYCTKPHRLSFAGVFARSEECKSVI